MSRISEREKTIRIFRKYARLGLASPRLDIFSAYERIKGASRNRREAYELLAVYDTVSFLKLMGREDTLDALYDIYFYSSSYPFRKSEISLRVLRHAKKASCDERTVYRKLAYALKIYKMMLGDR